MKKARAGMAPRSGGSISHVAAKLNGNSSTSFTLRLPSGAACGGDSAHDGYRVQSYIVPSGIDPSTLTFNSSGPVPAGRGATSRAWHWVLAALYGRGSPSCRAGGGAKHSRVRPDLPRRHPIEANRTVAALIRLGRPGPRGRAER